MDKDVIKPRPERDRTDESLQLERASTDEALTANLRRGAEADALIERARSRADTVLDEARDHADDEMHAVERVEEVIQAVVEERKLEDNILDNERRLADLRVQREREVHAATIQDLLPQERERTDRYLLHERTRADDELEHRDDFLGMVSHDLRNLLGGISLNASVLSAHATKMADGARIVEGATKIHRYVARMDRLISDLRDVVSIEAGKLSIRPRPCDTVELLSEVTGAFSKVAVEKGIRLSMRSERLAAAHAEIDRDRLMQVLDNLVSNALKFTAAGGEVVVSGESSDFQLLFSVADTGPGIPIDIVELIFQKFWQAGKNDQRGLGLGLYISRSIVEAHGGRIWVESVLGKESVFSFSIPTRVSIRA